MRPEGCSYHWKTKRRAPCTDCRKPTGSTSGQCPLHIRGYYVTQYYNRLKSNKQTRSVLLRREKTYEEIITTIKIMLANMQEKTYEELMDTYGNNLANLNITLCKECLHPINVKEGEYCDSCQPGSVL